MYKPAGHVTLAEYFEHLNTFKPRTTKQALEIAQEQTKLLIVLDHLESCLSLPTGRK